MSVCPLDYRYGYEEMKKIFSEEKKLEYMLKVEAALVSALAKYGIVPKDAAEKINDVVARNDVKIERVKEIENEIKHDVMAVVRALSEKCDDAGRYIHIGATSNDIIDTATALQIKDAISLIETSLEELKNILIKRAVEHKNTIMLGRTHGQSALPITFGHKLSVYALETKRHIERLKEIKKRILVGKMLGGVGTGAGFGDKALEIQSEVMRILNLKCPIATTQILQRDRYNEYVFLLSNICTSLEKFATEIRNLQRSEISEVEEFFDVRKQVGSSTMAHKRNPISAENICGLSRIVRSMIFPQMECAVQWHERDLTNSSAERFTISHTTILTHYLIKKTSSLFSRLIVNKEKMLENLKNAGDIIMAESLMLLLVKKGLGRQEAHEMVRKCAMSAMANKKSLFEETLRNDGIMQFVSAEEVKNALNPHNYTGVSEKIVEISAMECGYTENEQ